MAKFRNLIFSGEKFKEFLNKRSLTYIDAASQLKINKNTVGKAARSGNINVDVLLTICNTYKIPIDLFFKEEVDNENHDENQENSLYTEGPAEILHTGNVADDYAYYKKSEEFEKLFTKLSTFIKQENELIQALNDIFGEKIKFLEDISPKKKE